MASGGEWSCPICCNALGDAAYSMPCRHQFCLGCILRWLRGNRACPLCRTSISTISFPEQQQDCPQSISCHPGASPAAGSAPGSRDGSDPVASPAPSSQGTLSPAGPQAVGGILPELWAELFRRRWRLLDPVRRWLHRGLRGIYGDKWWQVKVAESSVLLALCIFGPDRDVLVQRLQLRLREYTAPLVQGVMRIIATQCSTEVRRLRRSRGPGEDGQSPGEDGQSPGGDRQSPRGSSVPAAPRSIPRPVEQEGPRTAGDALGAAPGATHLRSASSSPSRRWKEPQGCRGKAALDIPPPDSDAGSGGSPRRCPGARMRQGF